MSLQISNYGELKTKVKEYLNRNDAAVVDQIPTFIALAERKIFRQLRCPSNEKIASYTATPGGDGIKSISLPKDYLEAKLILVGTPGVGKPLGRISEQQYYMALSRMGLGRGRGTAPGEPTQFARIGNAFHFYPIPDDPGTSADLSVVGREYSLYYWGDESGHLDLDTDSTEILRIAPDLYLYGALLEAQPFIKMDERIATWSQMFTGTLDLINSQRDEAEYSGSNVGVTNAVLGAYGD